MSKRASILTELHRIAETLSKEGQHYSALLVVALRPDGTYDHGVVVVGEDFPRLVVATGAVLRRTADQFQQQKQKAGKKPITH